MARQKKKQVSSSESGVPPFIVSALYVSACEGCKRLVTEPGHSKARVVAGYLRALAC